MKNKDRRQREWMATIRAGRQRKDTPHRAVYRHEKDGTYTALCCDRPVAPLGGWIVHR
jgi:hypothetical protein